MYIPCIIIDRNIRENLQSVSFRFAITCYKYIYAEHICEQKCLDKSNLQIQMTEHSDIQSVEWMRLARPYNILHVSSGYMCNKLSMSNSI